MNIDDIIKAIPKINPSSNYWLVRTSAGEYYDIFKALGKIGIGYDLIEPGLVKQAGADKSNFYKLVDSVVSGKIDNEKPGVYIGNMYRFYCEMKKGDYVVIPSDKSEYILIGQVIDDSPNKFDFLGDTGDRICPHIHARDIKWIKEERRDIMNPKFIGLLFSHHAVVNANDYSEFIDASIHDVFIKGDQAHLVLRVNTTDRISANILLGSVMDTFAEVDGFARSNEIDGSTDDLQMRISVNSPGFIEFISNNTGIIALVGMVVVLLAGGRFKIHKYLEISSDGVVGKLLNYLLENREREVRRAIVEDSMTSLDVQQPKELKEIINQVRRKSDIE